LRVARVYACGTMHIECARIEKEKEEEKRKEGREKQHIRVGELPQGCIGWMLLFEFLSFKREPMEGTESYEHDIKIDNG